MISVQLVKVSWGDIPQTLQASVFHPNYSLNTVYSCEIPQIKVNTPLNISVIAEQHKRQTLKLTLNLIRLKIGFALKTSAEFNRNLFTRHTRTGKQVWKWIKVNVYLLSHWKSPRARTLWFRSVLFSKTTPLTSGLLKNSTRSRGIPQEAESNGHVTQHSRQSRLLIF